MAWKLVWLRSTHDPEVLVAQNYSFAYARIQGKFPLAQKYSRMDSFGGHQKSVWPRSTHDPEVFMAQKYSLAYARIQGKFSLAQKYSRMDSFGGHQNYPNVTKTAWRIGFLIIGFFWALMSKCDLWDNDHGLPRFNHPRLFWAARRRVWKVVVDDLATKREQKQPGRRPDWLRTRLFRKQVRWTRCRPRGVRERSKNSLRLKNFK